MTKNNALNKKIIFILLLVLYFIFLLVWSMQQKLNDCPDENMRYQIPKFIFDNHRLPTLYDSSIYDERWGFSYASNIQLPFLVGALFMRIAYFLGLSYNNLFWACRMVSILCGVVFAIFVVKLAKELFNNKILQKIFIVLTVLWPQVCFEFTYVNSNCMNIAAIAAMLYICARGLKYGWSIKRVILLGITDMVIVMSYLNGAAFVLAGGMIFVCSYVLEHDKPRKIKEMFGKGAIVALMVIAALLWNPIRNYFIYGTYDTSSIIYKLGMKNAIDICKPDNVAAVCEKFRHSPRWYPGWFVESFNGAFGKFGWSNISYPSIVYNVVINISIILILISAIYFVKNRKAIKINEQIWYAAMLVGSIVMVGLSFYRSCFSDVQPQGRYIVPFACAITYFITIGIKATVDKINKRFYNVTFYIITVFMILADIGAIYLIHKS